MNESAHPSRQSVTPQKTTHEDRIAELAEAIAALGGDTDFLIDALVQKLRSLRPERGASSLGTAERRFLIESGAMSEPKFHGMLTAIWRGVIHRYEVQSWMFRILDTLSAEEAADQLELTDEQLEIAVREGEVLAMMIVGRRRFPRWQFVKTSEGRLLPGMSALIPALSASEALSWAAFMHSPVEKLSGYGPRTPIQWLREGGEVEAVLELLRNGATD